MSREQLHTFDLLLCQYAIDAVVDCLVQYASRYELAVCWANKDALWKFIVIQAEEDVSFCRLSAPASVRPATRCTLLLNSKELTQLSSFIMLDGCQWAVCPWTHRQYLTCIPFLREKLAPAVAEAWAAASVAFGNALSLPELPALEGMFIVQEWIDLLRSYLGPLEAWECLPRPRGKCPTPTTLLPNEGSGDYTPGAFTPSDVEQVRQVLRNMFRPGQEHPAPQVVRKAAGMKWQKCLKILRHLESLGEYHGFSHRRVTR